MIRNVPSAWRTNMQSSGNEDRFYIDFRQIDYPDIGSGSPSFTLAREDNLIDRGNCESATAPGILGETGAGVNATWARSSDLAHGGEYSYKLTKTTAAGAGACAGLFNDNQDTTDLHGIVPGETVEVSCWIYVPSTGGPSASEAFLKVSYYDAAAWTTETISVSAQDTWEKLSTSVTVPSTATGFNARSGIDTGAALGEYIYVDDVIFKRHSVPGSHYMSGGISNHLVTLAPTGTIQVKFHSQFAFNVATFEALIDWYVSATQRLLISYNPTIDKFFAGFGDGTIRYMYSAQYDDGSANRNINQWTTLTLAYDTTTGDTTGSSLWMNKTQDATAWGGNIDAMTTSFNIMSIKGNGTGTTGEYDIAYVLYIPDYVATDADVQNDFKDVKDEQIYFPLDGHSVGRTRCNVTSFATDLSTQKTTRTILGGNYGANTADFEVKSLDGEFADDQYAAFDPANSVYNGTSSQKYMQNRCRVMIENWYNGDFDYVIVGRVDDSYFKRRTLRDGISFVRLTIEDGVADMGRKRIENAQAWEDKDIADPTETNSLIHLISRLQSSKKIRNYAHNSGFENATIGNAWTNTGGLLTSMLRDTNEEYFGSACCEMVYDNVGGGTQSIHQSIAFDNDEKVNVGETWTFSCFIKCAAAASDQIKLSERDSGGENDVSSTTYNITGGEGYTFFEVSHTITDSDSDELRIMVEMNDNVALYVDEVKLERANRASKFIVENTAETLDADDYAEGEYDTIGFDIDQVDIQHPWRRIEEGTTVWNNLSSLAGVTLPNYFGMNEAGTLELRAMLTNTTTNTYTDLIAEEDITENDFLMNISVALIPRYNRIVVKGSGYAEYTNKTCIWRATEMGNFTQGDDGRINESIANGDKWPDPDTYGDFYAYYSRRFDRETWGKKDQ